MSRRPGNHARRLGDNGGLFSSSKSRSSPIISLGLIVVVIQLLVFFVCGFGNLFYWKRIARNWIPNLENFSLSPGSAAFYCLFIQKFR